MSGGATSTTTSSDDDQPRARGPFLVIKTGRTWDCIRDRHGCFDDWMAAALAVTADDITVVSVFEGEVLPPHADDFCGVVITGSPAMVSDRLPWSEAAAHWLAREILERGATVPVIGICYGHQLLAHALGGAVDYNPNGREIGTVALRVTGAHAGDPLFHDMPDTFDAHVTHLQSAVTLPPGAVHLASSEREPHHAFRFREHVWGVQFHPEFSAPIMHAYIDVLAERMAAEGIDPARVRDEVRAAPRSNDILRRFARFARGLRSTP